MWFVASANGIGFGGGVAAVGADSSALAVVVGEPGVIQSDRSLFHGWTLYGCSRSIRCISFCLERMR